MELAILGVLMALVMLLTVGICASLPVVFWLLVRQQQRHTGAWSALGTALRAEGRVGDMRAVVQGHRVRIAERWEAAGNARRLYTDVEVAGPSTRISIRPQEMLSGLFGQVDHLVGDPTVDDHYVIGGHPLALGLLDPKTRHLLRKTRITLHVRNGILTLRRPGTVHDPELMPRMVTWAVALAQGLTATDDELARKMVHGVATDPDPRVRQRFLEVLQEHAPELAVTAAQSVRSHEDPSLRVLAATVAGDAVRLVAHVGDARLPEDVRIEAMQGLAGTSGIEKGVRVAIATPHAERLWRAAALAARGGQTVGVTHAIASLASALDPATWPASRELRGRRIAVAREVATTLGTLPPTPAGEALLLQLLAHDDGVTRSAAVGSLGTVGTVEAVPALQGVETTAGLLSSLGGAARTAVRAIQARSGGARGGVSLAATTAGDLALAQPEPPEAEARAGLAHAARRRGAPEA